jgi:hypothetical protein
MAEDILEHLNAGMSEWQATSCFLLKGANAIFFF